MLAYTQEELSLQKEIISADIGFIGAWVSYERHLNSLFTLKSAVGLEGGFGQGYFSDGKTYFAFTPTFKIEPRYYYNFLRRVQLNKKTAYNAANYFAFAARYFSNLVTLTNVDGLYVQKGLSLIPKVGIKRTLGQRINFEFALGVGAYFSSSPIQTAVGFDVRLGYNF